MASVDSGSPPRFANKIRDYLKANPGALDTLEGIARWWIGVKDVNSARGEVEIALQYLEWKGVVYRNTLADGRLVFAADTGSKRRDG